MATTIGVRHTEGPGGPVRGTSTNETVSQREDLSNFISKITFEKQKQLLFIINCRQIH